MRFDVGAYLVQRPAARNRWAAAFAGTETRGLCINGGREEAHIFARRSAAGAARPAEHAGGRDRVKELRVRVTLDKLGPGLVLRGIGIDGGSNGDAAHWVRGGEL